MKVECKISKEYKEPCAVLYINRMTETIGKIISMLEKDISLIRTEGREIVCYDKIKNRYVLDKPLYELENMLDVRFVRISKSAIANINQINHVEAGFNGTMELVMKNGVTDYISRSFRKSFKERLGLQ